MLSVCQLHLNKTGRKKVIIFTFFEKFPFFFFFGCTACRIFVPHPGIKLLPPVVKVQNLNHCTAREVPENYPFTLLIWGENYRVRDGQWHTILENFSIYSLAFHFIFKNFVYLLTFGCAGSLSPGGLFSSCGEQGLLSSCDMQDPHCGGFSCCGAWAVGCLGFSSCGSWALEHRLSSCSTWAQLPRSMWDLLGSGREPLSPALASGFFTTEPPGKPYSLVLFCFV